MRNAYDSLVNFCSNERITPKREQVLRKIIEEIVKHEKLKEIEIELKKDNPIVIHNQLVVKQRAIIDSMELKNRPA